MMGKQTRTKLTALETERKSILYLLLGVALFSLTSSAAKVAPTFIWKTTDEYVKVSSTNATTSTTSFMLHPRPAVVQYFQSDEANLQSDIGALPDVSVTCARSDFTVRVRSGFYGLGADASELRLGRTCQSNGVVRPYSDLLFSYPLTECGGVRELLPGYLVYKFVLYYDPSPEHFPSKAHPVTVNIECRYKRSHYLHKLAVKPTWEPRIVHQRLRASHTNFNIQLMDDTWTNPVKSRVFQLGERVNFQVSAPHLPPGQKLYIKSCYASPVTSSNSNVKFTIIDNYGCLMDSKIEPDASKFVTRTDKSVRFSLTAFQFVTDPEAENVSKYGIQLVSMEASITVRPSYRWEALSGDDVVCKCCDSQCVTSKRQRAMKDGITSSGSLWVSNHPDSPSYNINTTGVDKMRKSAEKAKNPRQKQASLKETADITQTEISSSKSVVSPLFMWNTQGPEEEKVQIAENNNDMLDVQEVNSTMRRLEYQRMKPEAVLKEKAASPLDPGGSENTKTKRVLKQSHEESVKVLEAKDTTWYFTWR